MATESFFERGAFLKTHHPELYDVLAWYYTQDPAFWPPLASPPPVGTPGRDRRRRRREAERRLRRGGPS